MIKESGDAKGGRSSLHDATLPSLVVISIMVVDTFWICDVILQLEGHENSGEEHLKVNHHPADIMVSVCHVILIDQLIRGPCDFMGRSPSS